MDRGNKPNVAIISYRYKSRMDRLKIPELEHQIKDAENENDSVAYSPP